MNKPPTNPSDSNSDSSFHLGWNPNALYNSIIGDLSLGSLSPFHIATLPPSSSLEHLPPPRGGLQRQSLSLPPPEFSAAALPPLVAAAPAPAPARRYQPRQSSSTKPRKKNSSSPSLRLKKGKSETITPPYEWATNRRATVHTLHYLDFKKIHEIKGEVQCRRCESRYEMGFDLIKKFSEVAKFVWENRGEMADRAPEVWMNPSLPTCRYCGQENSAKPVIPRSKKAINWLFLLLGQMLGCCTLNQLRYFCKHTRHHRTGAKDRVLYLTYLSLCKQLDPSGPFDR
ncbi:PREDICTED: uncharacterized protein LOC109161263 [Ipomoea nil]|uniref:uncharacterized protein LOC109161263 n=1 Tax=Ipomoea nil TaxID=35883 RepID=UPI0009012A3B|nr:PREDICTED: uncharacterized protein LOC109161263 [Ipomoea nil]